MSIRNVLCAYLLFLYPYLLALTFLQNILTCYIYFSDSYIGPKWYIHTCTIHMLVCTGHFTRYIPSVPHVFIRFHEHEHNIQYDMYYHNSIRKIFKYDAYC